MNKEELERLGLFLNLVGTILVAFSVKEYPVVSVNSIVLKTGLGIIVLGFIFQVFQKENPKKEITKDADKKYPKEYSNKELEEKINAYADVPVNSPDNVSYFTKASLGLIELQGRQNSNMIKLSLCIALLALIVSFITLFK